MMDCGIPVFLLYSCETKELWQVGPLLYVDGCSHHKVSGIFSSAGNATSVQYQLENGKFTE
jgi:hypothetical protein